MLLQVQTWLSNVMNLLDYGYKIIENILYSIANSKPYIPDRVLNIIFCKCGKEYTKKCTCKSWFVFISTLLYTTRTNQFFQIMKNIIFVYYRFKLHRIMPKLWWKKLCTFDYSFIWRRHWYRRQWMLSMKIKTPTSIV